MNPDTYFDGENPPGALQHGDFLMLGDDELGANLMLVKKSKPSEQGAVRWTLTLVGGPTADVESMDLWPILYVQRDGALIMNGWDGWQRIRMRVEDAVPLGINLYEDRDPADPAEVFDRAIAQAGLDPL